MAIGGKIGSCKGKVPSVAFGNHIIAVLGLATVAIGGLSWAWVATVAIGQKIGSGAARLFKGEVPSVSFEIP